MDGATEKLELGLQRLAKAGDDADMLGLALQSIHGALEDHFRTRLSADSHMPVEQRAAMADPKQTQWRDLLDAMQLYGDLSAPNRELIWRTNALRTKVAHGGRYTGSRAGPARRIGGCADCPGHRCVRHRFPRCGVGHRCAADAAAAHCHRYGARWSESSRRTQ